MGDMSLDQLDGAFRVARRPWLHLACYDPLGLMMKVRGLAKIDNGIEGLDLPGQSEAWGIGPRPVVYRSRAIVPTDFGLREFV